MTTVDIAPRDNAERSVWQTTLEVARLFDGIEWVIVGAQMVRLLEHMVGVPSGRTTRDVDAVIGGTRAITATRAAIDRLRAAGFERSVEHVQRYERGASQVDVLTIDHLRSAADDLVAVPGARRAFETARLVLVQVEGIGEAVVPVPSVSGAIALKVRAWGARRAGRDLEDIVRLLAIVDDVETVRSELKAAERRALGAIGALREPVSTAWSATSAPAAARSAFARLGDPPGSR